MRERKKFFVLYFEERVTLFFSIFYLILAFFNLMRFVPFFRRRAQNSLIGCGKKK